MLMEGAYLYLMVVKVYNAVVRMKLLYVFSWGRKTLLLCMHYCYPFLYHKKKKKKKGKTKVIPCMYKSRLAIT